MADGSDGERVKWAMVKMASENDTECSIDVGHGFQIVGLSSSSFGEWKTVVINEEVSKDCKQRWWWR